VEEEVMLLDAATLDLAPRAPEILAALGGDQRFKLEMPAAHLEIVLPPLPDASAVAAALLDARRDLARACSSLGLVACAAGVHPFADPRGELNAGERYESMLAEFGNVAREQLVCALQVHVAVRPADRAMPVYNALRPYLPLLAALAANAPLFGGRDTGLASIRPTICERLPQQGLPPELTWESYARSMTDPARWWWELRPHPKHGTLEVRVPDAQTTVEEAAAVVAVVHALVATLATRCQARKHCGARHANIAVPGTLTIGARHTNIAVPGTRTLEDDRRAAFTYGSNGPLGARLRALLDAIEPVAAEQGTSERLATARAMAERGGGAARQRAVFERSGARGAVADLADRFLED
jgi:carboxylate-amine ligase